MVCVSISESFRMHLKLQQPRERFPMAHKACFEKCVKRASLFYLSVLFCFFLLVPYGGGTISTPVVRTRREIHLQKHIPEQKCLLIKDFLPRAHRWCQGIHEGPHSPKCCVVTVCLCAHARIFLRRKPTDCCQILNRIHSQKCLEISDLAVPQPSDPHSHLKFESSPYSFIHAIIQFMLEHLQ